jgi:hypothetical protein
VRFRAQRTQDGFGCIGPVGNILYMSPSMVHLTGFASSDLEGCVRPSRKYF